MFFGQEMKINGFADTAAPPSGWSTALQAFNIIWPGQGRDLLKSMRNTNCGKTHNSGELSDQQICKITDTNRVEMRISQVGLFVTRPFHTQLLCDVHS